MISISKFKQKIIMKNYLLILVSTLIILLAKFLPFSFMVGSQAAFFSGSTTIALLLSRHLGLASFLLFLISLQDFTVTKLFSFLLKRAPLLFAGWSYRKPNSIVSLIVPIICFVLFVVHPVGQQAWPYALYWIIPVAIAVSKSQHVFLLALSSVFIAHAVGSTVWIYTHQMEYEVWLGLMPLVLIERTLMALGVVVGEYVIDYVVFFALKVKTIFNRKLA